MSEILWLLFVCSIFQSNIKGAPVLVLCSNATTSRTDSFVVPVSSSGFSAVPPSRVDQPVNANRSYDLPVNASRHNDPPVNASRSYDFQGFKPD